MPTSHTKREADQGQDVELPQSRTEAHPIRPVDTTTPAFLGLLPGAAGQPRLARTVDEVAPLIDMRVRPNATRTFLGDAVRGFFANGGDQCYIVPCPSMDPMAGLSALERVRDVSMVAIPDLWQAEDPKSVITAVVDHCARLGTRVAIIDLPPDIAPERMLSALPLLSPIQQQVTAVCHPWLQITEDGGERMAPPCGVMAGALARNDKARGVWAAPSVLEVECYPLVTGFADNREKLRQEEKVINILRALSPGKATVEGARTLSPGGDFIYLNVRRLVCFLVDSIKQSTTWATFEPNNEQLWSALRASTEAFLTDLWTRGALVGSTPEEGFHVICDKTNNTPSRETITLDIGIAPTRPAEFVSFTITQGR